jgi:hypothetical protein
MSGSWLQHLSSTGRAAFICEMRAVLDEASRTGDLRGVERCIRGWQATAHALTGGSLTGKTGRLAYAGERGPELIRFTGSADA